MKVLYVDDEPTIRRAVELWLSRHGITVATAAGVATARIALARGDVDAIFVDVWLEDGSGFDLYDHIAISHPTLMPRLAFVTGDVSESSGLDSRLARLGCPVLRKPFDLEELNAVVTRWMAGRSSSAAESTLPEQDARG